MFILGENIAEFIATARFWEALNLRIADDEARNSLVDSSNVKFFLILRILFEATALTILSATLKKYKFNYKQKKKDILGLQNGVVDLKSFNRFPNQL